MFFVVKDVFINRPWQPLLLASLLVALLVPMGKTDGSAVPHSAVAEAQSVAAASQAAKPAVPDPAHEVFARPLPAYRITQYFGHGHTGIDLAAPYGTPIHASKSGRVETRRTSYGYGNLVIIHHVDGSETYYAHQRSLEVTTGQWVNQGQVIGHIGMTGHTTGPHLHFEIRYSHIPQNPLKYLSL